MSPTQELFAVLAAIAFWEALLVVPRRATVLRAWRGRDYRALRPAELLGNERVGIVLAPWLPTLGRVHVTSAFVAAFDERGVVALDGEQGVVAGTKRIEFAADFAPRSDGHDLLLDAATRVRCDSPDEAASAARELQELAALAAGARSAARARRLSEKLDVAAADRALESFESASAGLRVACNAAFLWWAVALPAAAATFGLLTAWPWLVAGIALHSAWVIALFVRAHRRLYPARVRERRRHAVAFALAPLQAVRALDALGRPLLARFHPVAALLAATPREQASAALARELRMAMTPRIDSSATQEAAATSRDFAAAWAEALRDAARAAGFDEAQLLAPPPPLSNAERLYCPRCLAQYTAGVAECGDCRGIALQELCRRADA